MYLNLDVLRSIEPKTFQAQEPYPWVNPQHFIRREKFQVLLDAMPHVEQFRGSLGKQRKHNQASHDRYILDYERGMDIAQPWREFVEELCSQHYRQFVCSLLNVSQVRFRFHWHFTSNGGEVSPHCDSRGKIGSQIFYLNTEADWQWDWGGETVILDDGGRIPTTSAPSFEDFDQEYVANTRDNRSLLFGRRNNSWHGVRRIACPEGCFRKVFIVVFEEHRPLRMAWKRTRRLLKGKELVTAKERLMY